MRIIKRKISVRVQVLTLIKRHNTIMDKKKLTDSPNKKKTIYSMENWKRG